MPKMLPLSLFRQGRMTIFVEKICVLGNKEALQLFGEKIIRTAWNQEEEKWYFSIVDVCAALTDSVDAAAYWRKLKERLRKEGNETVTNCHAFKMRAADGKMRQTIYAIENDIFIPSTELVLRMSAYFGKTVNELFSL